MIKSQKIILPYLLAQKVYVLVVNNNDVKSFTIKIETVKKYIINSITDTKVVMNSDNIYDINNISDSIQIIFNKIADIIKDINN